MNFESVRGKFFELRQWTLETSEVHSLDAG
jgi:hypothetical protein